MSALLCILCITKCMFFFFSEFFVLCIIYTVDFVLRFTCTAGFSAMLNEMHDMAGQHEVVSENLTTSILRELNTLSIELKQERKKVTISCLMDVIFLN